jgi:ADP-ribose pyrophosphatase YjhB (NUDIX family)
MHRLSPPDPDLVRLVLESSKYRRWQQRVESHGNRILNLDVLSVVSRRPGSWYVAFLDCLLLTPEGHYITRCMTLRGDSVVVVPALYCLDDGSYYTLLVEQRCISDGALHSAFPAGGVEGETSRQVMACQELLEETGLELVPEELVQLSGAITLNTSLSDDQVYFYGFRKEVSRRWLTELDNKSSGLHREGEYLKVQVRTLAECTALSTTSTLIGLTLVQRAFGIPAAPAGA